MFPTIFSLGVAELGPVTGNGSGLLNMAIVGGAILPVIQGAIADHVGLHHAFMLPVICYLYILFYALNGSKPNSVRFRKSLRGRMNTMLAGWRYRWHKDGDRCFFRGTGTAQGSRGREVHSADYPSLEAIAHEFLAKAGLRSTALASALPVRYWRDGRR